MFTNHIKSYSKLVLSFNHGKKKKALIFILKCDKQRSLTFKNTCFIKISSKDRLHNFPFAIPTWFQTCLWKDCCFQISHCNKKSSLLPLQSTLIFTHKNTRTAWRIKCYCGRVRVDLPQVWGFHNLKSFLEIIGNLSKTQQAGPGKTTLTWLKWNGSSICLFCAWKKTRSGL